MIGLEEMRIEGIEDGVFRLLIPFEDEILTTVYVVCGEDGVALIDSATYPDDVERFILPALELLEIDTRDVRFLLLTHAHGDHAGGASRLLECLPNAVSHAPFDVDLPRFSKLRDGEHPTARLLALSLPGHTADSMAFLDLPTGTLLSGDCLQLFGVGKYRSGIGFPDLYRRSVERLRSMELSQIVAAHEYDPLGSIARGKEEIDRYLSTCLSAIHD